MAHHEAFPTVHKYKLSQAHRFAFTETREKLFALLEEMRADNTDTRQETLDDITYAFCKGRIVEIADIDDPGYIPSRPVAGFDLQGIHLVAYDQLAPSFIGDPTLDAAVAALFSRQLGFESLKSFGEFVGITLLAVLCPPAAELVMVAQAVLGYAEAKKLEGFYESFMDPEQLVSWSDVQAEQFVAKIMLAIMLIPSAGKIVRGFLGRARVILRDGLKEGMATILREELRALFKSLAEALKKDLVMAFLKETGKNLLVMNALEKMLTPLVADVQLRARLPAYRE